MATVNPALVRFLVDHFDERELRALMYWLPRGEELEPLLPGRVVSRRTLAEEVVRVVCNHGLLGPFLKRLQVERGEVDQTLLTRVVALSQDTPRPARRSRLYLQPAVNPYGHAASQLFYGREQVLGELWRNAQGGRSMVLVGGRRCGKTRLAERLHDWLRDRTDGGEQAGNAWRTACPDAAGDEPDAMGVHWPILVDLSSGVAGQELDATLGGLLQRVWEEVKAHHPGVHEDDLPPRPGDRIDGPDGASWLLRLDQALAGAGSRGVAMLLDELEACFRHAWHHDLMAWLRHVDDSVLRSRVVLVLVGSDGLDRYVHPQGGGSNPLNTARRVYLEPLDGPARDRMVREPFSAAGREPLPDAVQHLVHRLAGGSPWLLTNLLEDVFERDLRTTDAIEDLAYDVMDREAAVLQRWAQPLDGVDRAWELYHRVVREGRVPRQDVRGPSWSAARRILTYQALIGREGRDLVPGPTLFTRWAEDMGVGQ